MDSVAQRLYQVAGLDPVDHVRPEALAWTLGFRVRDDAPRLIGGAALVRVGGAWSIWVHPRLGPEARQWAIAHELAEWALRGVREESIEGDCDQAAAAIVAPRPAYREALRLHGENVPSLARAFVTSESCAVLRLGEVTGRPLALVSPGAVRVRGEDWGWPPEPELRRLARAKAVPRELRRFELSERGRVVLLAA